MGLAACCCRCFNGGTHQFSVKIAPENTISLDGLFDPTGKIANDNYGAYLVYPIGDTLLVGISNSPGNDDGGVLYAYDGSTFALETVLDEQGVVDMLTVGYDLIVPGLDPMDDWTLGNFYRKSGGAWAKIRTMPNVLHTFGMAYDGTYLYAAVGAHTGDNRTWTAQVLRSADSGQTWPQISTLGTYRCYHVKSWNSKIFASQCGNTDEQIMVSSDQGETWSRTGVYYCQHRQRYLEFDGRLVGVTGAASNQLFAISADGSVTYYDLPFAVAWQFNAMCIAGDSVYAVASDGYVWRSADLTTWTRYANLPGAVSLAHWPSQSCLVASDRGASAKLWKIALSG